MTDSQLAELIGAILAFAGAMAGALKWGVGRIVKTNDAATQALIDNTASNAVLGVKVEGLVVSNVSLGAKTDGLVASNQSLATKLDAIGWFIEENTPNPYDRPPRLRTPMHGVKLRPSTKSDNER